MGKQRVRIWWRERGDRQRESIPGVARTVADLTKLVRYAGKRRQQKLSALAVGRFHTPTSRTAEDLREALRASHEKDGIRQGPMDPLWDHWAGWRVVDIDYAAIEKFVVDCQRAGLANGTIRVRLAYLHRAFRVAKIKGLVAEIPEFPALRVQNTVECYFTPTELTRLYRVLRAETPHLAAAVEYAALTGWREGNVFDLTWDHVSFAEGKVHAPAGTTKNRDAIVTPFSLQSPLNALLRRQHRVTGGLGEVFRIEPHWRRAWRRAVGEGGLDKWGTKFDSRLDPATGKPRGAVKVRPRFHDLRHTFAQHMTDAGVAEGTIQESGGWKTRSAFERYRINTDRAKRDAMEQRDAYVERERAAAQRAPRVVDLNARRKAAGRQA